MTYLRHSSRHIHQTVFKYVTDQLTVLGWMSTDPTVRPFGATSTPVLVQDVIPRESEARAGLKAGTVAVTLGRDPVSVDEELGSGFSSIAYPFFVDCFETTPGVALSLATDIRDIFMGQLPTSVRVLPVLDFSSSSAGVAVDGWNLEFDDIERLPSPDLDSWHIVHVTATLYYPRELY